jgi:glycosyltransferase involved in cell wall biosynthesis
VVRRRARSEALLRVCFYAAVADPRLFELVEFYRHDIEALTMLGHEVVTANRPGQLPASTDLYWTWWQTSGLPAVAWSRLRSRPCVLVTALSDRDLSASGMASKSHMARLAARASLRLADVVLPASDDTATGLTTYRTRRMVTVPLGIDTGRYAPPASRSDDRPLVLTVSHQTRDNVERKRLLDVVRAASRIRDDVRFVIAGGFGDGTQALRRETERLGVTDRVELTGAVSVERKLELLQEASVYLQPTEYEAFGMAIGEAMSCGLPVVSHATGNVPALVGDAGVLLPPAAGDADIAEAVQGLLTRPAERLRLGRLARERIVGQFSFERRRAALEDVIGTVAR